MLTFLLRCVRNLLMEIEFKYKIDNEEQANMVFGDPDVERYKDKDSEEELHVDDLRDVHAVWSDGKLDEQS